MDCNDSVACTVDSFNGATDSCNNTPDNAVCSDGLFCNEAEVCNPSAGCEAESGCGGVVFQVSATVATGSWSFRPYVRVRALMQPSASIRLRYAARPVPGPKIADWRDGMGVCAVPHLILVAKAGFPLTSIEPPK